MGNSKSRRLQTTTFKSAHRVPTPQESVSRLLRVAVALMGHRLLPVLMAQVVVGDPGGPSAKGNWPVFSVEAVEELLAKVMMALQQMLNYLG
jgi:hypothetical protein